jgi:hypothetical protein
MNENHDDHRVRPDGSDRGHGTAPDPPADGTPSDPPAHGRSYFPAHVVSVARWNLADLRVRRSSPPPR